MRELLSFGLPLSGSGLLFTVRQSVQNVLLSRFASSMDLGNYTVAMRLGPLVDAVNYPITTMLFPTFSALSERNNVRIVFNKLVKLSLVVVAPTSLLIMVLSRPLLLTFFRTAYEQGWPYLSILAVHWLTYALGGNVANYLLWARD
ncbi:hypothetical protein HRbin02_00171 [Candidatus Calditenuaceae archaeon HR02]|nr:hypothetical protein HRbin02_00171 [Candidatus Calditenuaceae archaeon HR02]